uniref:Uncharacterized protein n=1 Tax=Apteryx owenii TaxID=8824 RepID=A0A8B9P0R3_APTOW
ILSQTHPHLPSCCRLNVSSSYFKIALEISINGTNLSAKITCLQHSLLAHSNWNIIMSVIFSYESHHRPVLLWVIWIKSDEFISTIFIQSINLDGVLQSISKEEHFHLHQKKAEIKYVKLTISFMSHFS